MIDFKNENTGTWCPLIEGYEAICLRMPNAKEWDDIHRLTVKPGKDVFHRGQRYETEKTDEKLSQKLSLRKFIVDWRGISLDGVEIECTDENKEKMMNLPNPDFRIFVGECLDKMVDKNKTIEAARAKNLNDSLDGDSVKEGNSVEKSA